MVKPSQISATRASTRCLTEAPDAKILYAGEYGVTTGKELEEMMNEHGSRISSNSWGDYDIYIDPLNHGSVAMRSPQSLFVFASGNH